MLESWKPVGKRRGADVGVSVSHANALRGCETEGGKRRNRQEKLSGEAEVGEDTIRNPGT